MFKSNRVYQGEHIKQLVYRYNIVNLILKKKSSALKSSGYDPGPCCFLKIYIYRKSSRPSRQAPKPNKMADTIFQRKHQDCLIHFFLLADVKCRRNLRF